MSNQVYKNSAKRYDLANISRATYNLAADTLVANGGLIDVPYTETKNETEGAISYSGNVFTINLAGVYSVDMISTWAHTAGLGNRLQYLFYPNDSGVALSHYADTNVHAVGTAATTTIVCSSATFVAAAGDTFTAKAGQVSGGDINLLGTATQSSLYITRIA